MFIFIFTYWKIKDNKGQAKMKNKTNYTEDDVSKAVAEVNNGISIR